MLFGSIKNRIWTFALLLILAMASTSLRAQNAPHSLNISGGLFNSAGVAIAQAAVNFKIEILDKNATCVLYSEQHLNEDLSSTKGAFSLIVGQGSSIANNLEGTAALSAKVFLNNGATGAFTGCASGVTNASGDERLIRVYFDLGAGFVAMTPDVPVVSSAFALVAESLQGKSASDFAQINTGSASLSQANLENIFSNVNYPKLNALVNGSSTQYLAASPSAAVDFNSQRLTSVATPTSATDAANKSYADSNVGGKTVDVTGVGAGVGGGKTLVWDQALNKWVAQTPAAALSQIVAGTGLVATTITSAGTLAVDVGTTANKIVQLNAQGKLPALDGFLLTNIAYPVSSVAGRTGAVTLNAADILGLGTAATQAYGTAGNDLVQLNASAQLPAVDGSLLTNVNAIKLQSRSIAATAPAAGQVLTWNATTSVWEPRNASVSGITDLTGDVSASGSGSVSATIANSAITSAKINASGYAINRLLITDSVNPNLVTYANCSNGDVLKYGPTGWLCNSTSGSVSLLVTGTGLVAGSITTSGTLNVDTGTTAGKILQLTAGAQYPGVDGNLIANINAVKLQSRTIASTAPAANQVLTWNNTTSQWEPQAAQTSANAFVQTGNAFGVTAKLGTTDVTNLNFLTCNNTQMTVTSQGNVGIGTTSPQASLDVNGAIDLSGLNAISYPGNDSAGVGASIAIGVGALTTQKSLAPANYRNTAVGYKSLGAAGLTSTATYNTALGYGTLYSNQSGYSNTAIGVKALYSNGTGNDNVAIGAGALANEANSTNNTVIGYNSMNASNGGSSFNTAVGFGSLSAVTSASSNTAIGDDAGASLTTGSGNILIGAFADVPSGTTSNFLNIGNLVYATNLSNVGIGTTSPARRLEISGTDGMRLDPTALPGSPGAGDIVIDSGASNTLKYYNGSSWVSSGSGTVTSVMTGTGLVANTISINGTLAVDVGTLANKIVQLTTGAQYPAVDGNLITNVNASKLQSRSIASTAPVANQVLTWNNTTSQWEPQAAQTAANAFVQNGNSFGVAGQLGTTDVTNLNFLTCNNVQMTITSRGNVGIGTTTPGNPLTIVNTSTDATPPDSVFDNGFLNLTTNGAAGMTVLDVQAHAHLNSGVTGSGSMYGMILYSGRNFNVSSGDSGTLSSLYGASINYGHFFSDATATPQTTNSYGLYVKPYKYYGTQGNMYDLYLDNPSGSGTVSGNQYGVYQLGSTKLNSFAGTVGIGTTLPARRLEISGTDGMRLDPTALPGSPAAGDIVIDSGASNTLKYYNGSGWVSSGSGTVTSVISGTGLVANTVSLAGTINVDVGTVANKIVQLTAGAFYPAVDGSLITNLNAVKLQSRTLASTAPSANQVLTWNSTTAQWEPQATQTPANSFVQNGNAFGTTAQLGTTDVTNLNFLTCNNVQMTITSKGNVGIGTTNPLYTLTVSGPVYSSGGITGAQFYGLNFRYGYGSSSGIIGPDSGTKPLGLYADSSATILGLYMSSAGNVGIATTTPNMALDVNGTGTFSGLVVPRDTTANRPASTNGTIRYNTNTSKFEFYESGAWVNHNSSLSGFLNGGNAFGSTATLGTTDVTNLNLITSNAPRLTVGSSGNVGIGTSTPVVLLDVNGSAQLRSVTVIGTGGSIQPTLSRDSATGGLIVSSQGNGASADFIYQSNNGGTPLERLRIQGSSGSVGVGTPAPYGVLDLISTGTFSSLIVPRDSTANRNPNPVNGMVRYNLNTSKFEFYESGAWVNHNSSLSGFLNGGNAFGANASLGTTDVTNLTFLTCNNTQMVITSRGNVGIGITNPGASLEVSYSSTVNPGMVINRTANSGNATLSYWPSGALSSSNVQWITGMANNSTDFRIYSWDGSTNGQYFVLQNNGNLGLGTTTPGAALDVNGTGTSSGLIVPRDTTALRPAAVNGTIRYNTNTSRFEAYESGGWTNLSASGSSAFINGGNAFGSTASLGTTDVTNLNFLSCNNVQMTITSRGNVGIGTTSPAANLHISRPDAGSDLIRITRTDSPYTWGIGLSGNRFNINNTTGSGTPFTIDSTGNVGIGTTTPAARLSVLGTYDGDGINIYPGSSSYGNAVSVFKNGGATYGAFGMANTAGNWLTTAVAGDVVIANSSGSNSILFGIGSGAEKMRLSASGNLGVGTNAPAATLEVLSTSTLQPGVRIRGDSSAYWPQVSIWFVDAASGGHQYSIGNGGSVGKFAIADQTAGVARLTIDQLGNVGIGTATPAAKLDILGSSSATLRIVDGNQGAGKVLTSDATGQASWQTPSGSGTYTTSCAINAGAGANYCVRMVVATGATSCMVSTAATLAAATWSACTGNPFSAGTTGIYSLSCTYNSNTNQAMCIRLDAAAGTSSCAYSNNVATTAWSACANNPF